ncbi:MAG TPA: hypothetical protein VMU65_02270 [Candidatus Saccharimonadales bacterium]|nr:hypothetical protein [Candidatus Saccharimonadales bacterium]
MNWAAADGALDCHAQGVVGMGLDYDRFATVVVKIENGRHGHDAAGVALARLVVDEDLPSQFVFHSSLYLGNSSGVMRQGVAVQR